MGAESLKIKKISFFLLTFFSLSGCVEPTAFLGPALTAGTSGNVYHASLSYASNQIIYNSTGKTTIEHVTNFLDPNDEFDGDLKLILKDNASNVKKIINKPQTNLSFFKSKKHSETVLKTDLEDQFILF